MTTEGGSSDSPCNEMYHGPEAFSEVESRVVRDAIWAEANRTKSYLTVHSYGQVCSSIFFLIEANNPYTFPI